MAESIGFYILVAILATAITGALGTWIAGEKGISTTKGLLIGMFTSIFGVLYLAFAKRTDAVIVQEMYDRNMMGLKEYEKTMEIKLKEQTK